MSNLSPVQTIFRRLKAWWQSWLREMPSSLMSCKKWWMVSFSLLVGQASGPTHQLPDSRKCKTHVHICLCITLTVSGAPRCAGIEELDVVVCSLGGSTKDPQVDSQVCHMCRWCLLLIAINSLCIGFLNDTVVGLIVLNMWSLVDIDKRWCWHHAPRCCVCRATSTWFKRQWRRVWRSLYLSPP